MAQAPRKFSIADVLGFGASPRRDLTQGYRREVGKIKRGEKLQGSISRARPTAAQELSQLLTPDTRGGAEFANRLTPAIENIPLLGGLLSLVDARRAYNAGNSGQAAGLGILAALGAIPGGKAGSTTTRKLAEETFDPALYKIIKRDVPEINKMTVDLEETGSSVVPEKINVEDLIGRPFISTMADRTAAGKRIVGINNTNLNLPVNLQGGQDFMFNPTTEGALWASAKNPVTAIRNVANQLYRDTGKKPLFLPFRMAGAGSDFATMTGETMMSYADAVLGAADKSSVNKLIGKYIPKFAGIDNPKGYEQFRALSGGKRKEVQAALSDALKGEGGLSLEQTRMAIVDPNQINKPSYFLQNVGEIDPEAAMIARSGHPSYEAGFAGKPLGILADEINVAEILPNFQKAYGIENPFAYSGQNTKWTPEEAAARGLKSNTANTGKYLRSAISSGILTEDMAKIIAGRR
jgi:hypothetical protein